MAITLITIAVIALAVVAALLYNRHVWRPRQARDPAHADGLNATEASVPICYAISVAEQDWPAMGDREVSSVPTYWGQQIRDIAAAEVRKRHPGAEAHELIEHDGDRSTARQARLGEARPAFGATLLLIRDLDQPYDGVTGRSPAETEFIVDLIRPDAPAPLPCDDAGLPTDDPAFVPSRIPLG